MTDTHPRKHTVDALITAHRDLHRRAVSTIGIISHIAAKTRPEHLPAGFAPLTRSDVKWAAHYRDDGDVEVRYDRGCTLRFPQSLLVSSDRDVATWARSEVRRCRTNAFYRARKRIQDDIDRDEVALSRLTQKLDERRRQLTNLGKVPPRA